MNSEVVFVAFSTLVFTRKNYHVYAVRMEAFLDANDLWDAIEQDYIIPTLPHNSTVAQIKNEKEKKQIKSKARACLYAVVSPIIFNRIMTLKTVCEIWKFLKQEYEKDERFKGMQVMNLIREFEMQRMRDSETIKEYSDKLIAIVNNVRLFGTEFSDSRIVQKIIVSLSEKYEAAISSMEMSKDMSSITLAEVLNALQAQGQRRLMRQERLVERSWLIDSGSTNHMTYDRELFKELDKTVISKVRIGNGAYIETKGHERQMIHTNARGPMNTSSDVAGYEEAATNQKLIDAIKEELMVIEKKRDK
ncbi:PREDICTED: uncharacterized protein LOC109352911 [Lupinus angustifolius]|uniref:uncharacterized protein LOC109352911 n=1 Tax=Lupinus angustifolius TaxID=3871 RepID=UPI00092F0E5F|nr:PREDICTED: uncharacterized protein LOC109352911 [Lupinus angustifolius]